MADTTEREPEARTVSELEARIDPWLAHMRWRPGFESWRQQRIDQEHHQSEALRLLGQALAIAETGATISEGVASVENRKPKAADLQLLDMGCGMGGFAVAAARDGARVTALDYNPAYCAITAVRAARYGLPLPVAAAAGEAIPLPDGGYDAVVCLDVLEHVQQPDALVAELHRVLRPGGVALITAINRFAFRDPHYHLPLINWLPRPLAEALIAVAGRRKGGAFRDRQRLSAMHYYTWPGVERLARRHGFALHDLDERRVARGEVGARHRWRRALARLGLALPAYRLYRAAWQGTWRLALVKGQRANGKGQR
jgi:2-polyprenyl-3-methyl-5-hydroxy-6-metoxy-1,4-benzoquinol methylase